MNRDFVVGERRGMGIAPLIVALACVAAFALVVAPGSAHRLRLEPTITAETVHLQPGCQTGNRFWLPFPYCTAEHTHALGGSIRVLGSRGKGRRCVSRREVKVIRVEGGEATEVGTARSNDGPSHATYWLNLGSAEPSGEYYVRIERLRRVSGQHRHACAAAASERAAF